MAEDREPGTQVTEDIVERDTRDDGAERAQRDDRAEAPQREALVTR